MTNTVNGAAVQQPTIKKKSRAGEIWRRFRKNKLAVFGMILFALILLVAIFCRCDRKLQRGHHTGGGRPPAVPQRRALVRHG